MPNLKVILATLLLCSAGSAFSGPFPPLPEEVPTLVNVEQVMSRIGIVNPEYSSHLKVDAPDVIAPGPITVNVASEIPGTTRMLLFRGAVGIPVRQSAAVAGKAPVLLPALVSVWSFDGESAPHMRASYEVLDRQWVTLLAQAQGRWFVVAKEIKVGVAATEVPRGRASP